MNFLRKSIYLLVALSVAPMSQAALSFSGNALPVFELKPEASTGLDMIYVVYDTNGVTAETQGATVSRFSNLGGGYAQEYATADADGRCRFALQTADMGYIVEDGTRRYYYWVVNYATHRADLQGLGISAEQECDRAALMLMGSAPRINYYTINGQARELSRELKLTYETLEFDDSQQIYVRRQQEQTLAAVDGTIRAFAPLCDTQFTLEGDRFLRYWGMGQTATSDLYRALAIDARTWAVQETRDYENEQDAGSGGLGGSAPVTIEFTAAVTDAAVFREWQMSHDAEFENVFDRYPQTEMTYTFRENGTTYVRFVADNDRGTCEFDGETYEVQIGESALLCPNAFSPGVSPGVNDEWRVSYKSIVSFECHIFNRWGQEMISFTDPGKGWDGRYNGKLVPSGVYYYVIKAKGSEGKHYNLSGDINIVNFSNDATTNQD